MIYQGAGKRPGSEKKGKNTEKNRKSMFLLTQSKKANLRRRLNHLPIFILALFMIYKKAVKILNKFNESFLSYG